MVWTNLSLWSSILIFCWISRLKNRWVFLQSFLFDHLLVHGVPKGLFPRYSKITSTCAVPSRRAGNDCHRPARIRLGRASGNVRVRWRLFGWSCEYKIGNPFILNGIIIFLIKFWSVFNEMDDTEKRKFLEFYTGSDKVPVGGLARLKTKIQRSGPDSDRLPTGTNYQIAIFIRSCILNCHSELARACSTASELWTGTSRLRLTS